MKKTTMTFALGFALALAPGAARADGAKFHAREIKPTSDYVWSAAALAGPTPQHPEGTVVVADGSSTMEVDVLHTTVVTRLPFRCEVLHRISSDVLGICGGDVVAFGPSLGVSWRAHWASVEHLAAKDVFFDGRGLVVATFRDDAMNLVLRVASASGATVSEVHTTAHLYDGTGRTSVYFHAGAVLAQTWQSGVMRGALVVLSADGRRIRARRELVGFDGAWDDGAHVHLARGSQDVTLDDSLRPIRTGPLAPLADTFGRIPPAQVSGLGGTGVRSEFDLGANHFWYTFGCCGDHPGLFVAKVR